ncbi:GDT1-like protein sll0615 [Dermatophagoides pteronyssinus]|uniref:GDT1 family protein n=1 Tax=Dermatophagoides pteronyssinus TaxID=6956 RepID=A0A6P6YL42_DERPT|nr:uncharacterized protein LOC113799782 [Dermatophagoides pteronyssinus]
MMQEFWNSFLASFTLTIASEFGDKTFLTTSIFSLKYPRWLVFISSMFALTTMNIVSLFLGKITANIPTYIIETISIILFGLFGIKMIFDGYNMKQDMNVDLKQMEKIIENEIVTNKKKNDDQMSSTTLYSMVFLKIFSLIFLAEWGDRSQLSTILLSAKQNGGLQWAVGFGSFLGNFFTNSIAILCSTIVSEIISIRTVQIIGGFTFIFCSIFKYYYS